MLLKNTLKIFLLSIVSYIPINSAAQCTATLSANTTSSCQDSVVTLTASPAGLYDYQWFINGQLGPLGMEVYDYEAWTPGTYTFEVQITDNNNCTVISNPVTVVIHPNPNASAGGSGLYCPGSTVQLTATSNLAASYTWTGPNNYTSTSQNNTIPNFQGINGGTYTVVANFNGCNSWPAYAYPDTQTSVVSTEAYTISDICEGHWLDLHVSSTGINNVNYAWTGPNNYSANGDFVWINNAQAINSGTYTATITGDACTGPVTFTEMVNVTVHPAPYTAISTNAPLCEGGTLTISLTGGGGTYEWTGPDNFTSNQMNVSIPNVQQINEGWYHIVASLGACTINDYVDVDVLTNNPSFTIGTNTTNHIFCIGDMAWFDNMSVNDISNPTYTWSGPGYTSTNYFNNFWIQNNADSGVYVTTVSGMTCNGSVTLTDSVVVDVRPCVWPGDVNNDYIANNMDVLDLGLGYGAQGPNRPGATYGWGGQYMTDWGNMQFCLQDMKFADCNGNGIITASDTFGIALNYGEVHLKGGPHVPQAKSASFPDLFFDMSGIIMTPGAAVSIPIKLGTSNIPMVDVYGLAAEIKMNGITPDSLYISAPSGWMGNINNTMNFTRRITQTQTDWAYVRIDHNNVNGEGTIALLEFTVPMGTDYQQVQLYFDNVKIIGNTGNVITTVNILDGEGTIVPTTIAATQTNINSAIVVPNPSEADATLQLSLIRPSKMDIVITDLTGRKVWRDNVDGIKGQQNITLPSQGLAPGIYTIQVRDEHGNLAKTLKWSRK